MIYLTQLVYVRPGEEATFQRFENVVLPLLSKYRGELLLRLRPTSESLVSASIELPYELHFLRFKSEQDLDDYARDEVRQSVLGLRDRAVSATLLVTERSIAAGRKRPKPRARLDNSGETCFM